jgi:hypothetical protein
MSSGKPALSTSKLTVTHASAYIVCRERSEIRVPKRRR